MRKTPLPDISQFQDLYIEYTPVNDGYFWFRKPITKLESFTISFANPLVIVPIPVPSVSALCYNFSSQNPTVINIANTFANGTIVVVNFYTTGDPIGNQSEIANVNNPNGHIITVIDSQHFSIPVDLTGVTQLSFSTCKITDINQRLIIPLEIIYIEPDSNEIDN